MKFLRLDLIAYGGFTDCAIPLDAKQTDFHIIYGANEAGKSTTHRAMLGLLFGIDFRITDDFVHAKQDLKIGAKLATQRGETLYFQRLKRNKQPLLDADDKAVDESQLTHLLGGINLDQYSTAFGLNHGLLVEGGRELLAGKGNLGESIFVGSTGLTDFHKLRAALAESSDSLFKPGGSKPAINKLIKDVAEAANEVKRTAALPKDWAAANEKLNEQDAALGLAQQALSSLNAALERLQRIERRSGAVRKLLKLRNDLEPLAGLGVISQEDIDKRRAAETRIEQAERDAAKADAEKLNLEQQRGAIAVPADVLEHQAAIRHHVQRVQQYRDAIDALKRTQLETDQCRSQALERLALIGKERDLAILDTLAYNPELMAAINRTDKNLEAARSNLRNIQAAATTSRKRLDEHRRKIESLPPKRDLKALNALIKSARSKGDIEGVHSKKSRELTERKTQAATELAALGRWQGSLEALARLPLPERSTIEEFLRRDEHLIKAHENAASELRRVEQAIDDKEKKVRSLTQGANLQTDSDLAASRTQRNNTWDRIRGAWIDGRPLGAESPAEVAHHYSGLVAQADEIADAIRGNAEKVARYQMLKDELVALTKDKLDAERTVERQHEDKKAFDEAWRTEWIPSTIAPASPKAMLEWYTRRDRLCQAHTEINTSSNDLNEVAVEIERLHEMCVAHLTELGVVPAAVPKPLGMLLSIAESVNSDIAAIEQTRVELQNGADDEERNLAEAAPEIEKSQIAVQGLEGEWQALMARQGVAISSTAEDAARHSQRLQALIALRAELNRLESGVAQHEALVRAFREDTQQLATALKANLADTSADEFILDLNERLSNANKAQEKITTLELQIERQQKLVTEATRDQATSQRQLDELIRAASCTNVVELKSKEEQSTRYRQLETGRQELEMDLAGEPVPLNQLIDEVTTAPETVADEIQRLKLEAKNRGDAMTELAQHIGKTQAEMARFDGRADAAQAEERVESACAQIDGHVRDYAVAKMAEWIINRQLERFTESNQGAFLTRVGEIFRDITLGAFEGVVADVDDKDALALRCRRPDKSKLDVTALSEGTRDQLFLALRLAAIEKYVTENEPLPVIIDDALINFDDDRSRATLQVFQQLGAKTQVLFFTHHAKLLDLAKEVLEPESYRAHDLAELKAAAGGNAAVEVMV